MLSALLLQAQPVVQVQPGSPATADRLDAAQIVRSAIDHWRGRSSITDITMVIHRPDWERSMTMRAWTKGDDQSLVRVLEPSKDRGNGTLTAGDSMWSYSPRVNRVIKIPSSMMGQSWMGSDFSNKDIAKADDIVDKYEHSLLRTSTHDGKTVYHVQSVPHEDAAVVWGRELLEIREDFVVLRHSFYDQDDALVKTLSTLSIGEMGGRTTALRQRMSKVREPDEWTEVRVEAVEYDVDLRDSLFTLSSLRNPRE
jgi:outer membrane lipoprotein-sorting protein